MPIITKISEQKRRENRRNIYIDGAFAFGVNLNVVARFHLREGLSLSAEDVAAIERGEVRQECFDRAIRILEGRLHGRQELKRKLSRHEFGEGVIEGVLNDLERLAYVDDERFAKVRAQSAAQYKHHGKRRAMAELLRVGIKSAVAQKALDGQHAVPGKLHQRCSSCDAALALGRVRNAGQVVPQRRSAWPDTTRDCV